MKNTGLVFLLVGAIIYGSTLISASVYSQTLISEGIGWDSQYGVFGTAIREVGTLPIIIASLSGILGLILVIVSLRKPKPF